MCTLCLPKPFKTPAHVYLVLVRTTIKTWLMLIVIYFTLNYIPITVHILHLNITHLYLIIWSIQNAEGGGVDGADVTVKDVEANGTDFDEIC